MRNKSNAILALLCLFFAFSLPAQTILGKMDRVWDGDSYRIEETRTWVTQDTTFTTLDSVVVERQRTTKTSNVYLWTIRICGADSPEKPNNFNCYTAQEYGLKAAETVRAFLKGKQLSVDTLHVDKYDRYVAFVQVSDGKTSVDLTKWLIQNGLAWYVWDDHFNTPAGILYYKELQKLQKAAKKAKLGLWSSKNTPSRPSSFRYKHRKC